VYANECEWAVVQRPEQCLNKGRIWITDCSFTKRSRCKRLHHSAWKPCIQSNTNSL